MIKIMRPIAEKVLVVLAYLANQGTRAGLVLNEGYRYTKHLDRNTVLRFITREGIDERHENWNVLMDHLEEALKAEAANDNGEGDSGGLIEEIVKLLQMNYGRNVFSGRNLAALRKLVLLPNEMAGVVDGMRKTLACAGCGHQFDHRELTVFSPDNEKEGVFFCLKCLQPGVVACRASMECEDFVPIPDNVLKGLMKSAACEKHKNGKKLITKDDTATDEPGRQIVFTPRNRRFAAANFRAAAANPPAPAQPIFVDEGGGLRNPFDQAPEIAPQAPGPGWVVVGQDQNRAQAIRADVNRIWGAPAPPQDPLREELLAEHLRLAARHAAIDEADRRARGLMHDEIAPFEMEDEIR